MIVANLIAGVANFQGVPEHRQLTDTHLLLKEMLELDLRAMEAEWRRRHSFDIDELNQHRPSQTIARFASGSSFDASHMRPSTVSPMQQLP
ncbi:hypothetical protein [Rhizobium sp. AG207R]|uniref:hypothetical protein n=1 Tax=Rhizobium sp. AG207R TaxID=2802287 RepID=UPI0022AC8D37|nr:hypothetical protein [Rhizobium sp. AG207R]MCZ3378428.1 hypothetical protein [Rhizobium sp. AG207R]